MTTISLAEGTAAALPPAEHLASSNCGSPGVWRFRGAAPGPRVVITALIHGNEVCGAVALAPWLESAPAIDCGELTLVFCNLEAYSRITDETKSHCRYVDEDLNRVWGRVDEPAAGEETYEMRRAREILPFFEGTDVLLDLHSMTQPAPALGLVGRADKNVTFAKRVGFPGLLVKDAGHTSGRRLIDRPAFGDAAAAPVAMLVECGEHFSLAAMDAARTVVERMLAVYLRGEAVAAASEQVLIEVTEAVTIEDEGFAFVQEWPNMGVVPAAGTLIAMDGMREVRTPHADAYMVMPATEAFRKPGLTAVRFARRV